MSIASNSPRNFFRKKFHQKGRLRNFVAQPTNLMYNRRRRRGCELKASRKEAIAFAAEHKILLRSPKKFLWNFWGTKNAKHFLVQRIENI
jgi:hypothetical protein